MVIFMNQIKMCNKTPCRLIVDYAITIPPYCRLNTQIEKAGYISWKFWCCIRFVEIKLKNPIQRSLVLFKSVFLAKGSLFSRPGR